MLICPKCRGKLNISDASAVCVAGHSFDRSKEGYFNLLLGAGGGTHGDNAEMIKARREFLEGGFYEPLAGRLSALAAEYAPDAEAVLDAGCGEGYYTQHIAEGYRKMRGGIGSEALPRVYAFDISKEAVKRACKRMKDISCGFAVASSYAMPISDGSVDLLVNTFSPLAIEECRRVLRVGGIFLMAIPAEEHLFELKASVYDTPYKNTVDSPEIEGFRLLLADRLKYTMALDGRESIKSLFMMTPYAYRTGAVGRDRVAALSRLDCTAHFMIFVYERL